MIAAYKVVTCSHFVPCFHSQNACRMLLPLPRCAGGRYQVFSSWLQLFLCRLWSVACLCPAIVAGLQAWAAASTTARRAAESLLPEISTGRYVYENIHSKAKHTPLPFTLGQSFRTAFSLNCSEVYFCLFCDVGRFSLSKFKRKGLSNK